MLRLAAIGLGHRAANVVAVMNRLENVVRIAGIVDPNLDAVRAYVDKQDLNVQMDDVKVFDSAERMLANPGAFDGVIIGTRCHMHTDMACKVAPTGLPLYLEKPVAITRAQLERLAAAFKGREKSVLVSFPLRVTPLYLAAKRIIESGRLGTINQVQAFNNVNYGGVYFGEWYRNYDQVGGLWLQKATHDFDYINDMLGVRPLMIAATTSELVYGGDKPHELVCSACDEAQTCVESHLNITRRGNTGGMGVYNENRDHACCFSREIRNQDAGSALVMYDGGVHVNYTQNFVSRRSAGKRGALIIGHKASLEFDWFTEKIRVIDHFDDRVDDIAVKASTGHSGGDDILCGSFVAMMRGQAEPVANLSDGLMSVAMCLAARESAFGHTFEPIILPGQTSQSVPRPQPGTEVPVS